jgi:hypothetical protein
VAALAPEAFRAQPGAVLDVAKGFEPSASPTVSRPARTQGVMGAHTWDIDCQAIIGDMTPTEVQEYCDAYADLIGLKDRAATTSIPTQLKTLADADK